MVGPGGLGGHPALHLLHPFHRPTDRIMSSQATQCFSRVLTPPPPPPPHLSLPSSLPPPSLSVTAQGSIRDRTAVGIVLPSVSALFLVVILHSEFESFIQLPHLPHSTMQFAQKQKTKKLLMPAFLVLFSFTVLNLEISLRLGYRERRNDDPLFQMLPLYSLK